MHAERLGLASAFGAIRARAVRAEALPAAMIVILVIRPPSRGRLAASITLFEDARG
jgi:hypothetical protein